jgi:AcrR family transcriptional regulator
LFSDRGYEETTTNHIAKRAGVSVGTFYKYFIDKREIFLEIYREYSQKIQSTVATKLDPEEWRGVDLHTGIRSLIRTAFQSHMLDPGLQHAFARIAMKDPEFENVRTEIRALLRAPLERLLENRRHDMRTQNIALAAFLIDEAVEACLHRNISQPPPFSEEELIEELARMVTGYLTYSGGGNSYGII